MTKLLSIGSVAAAALAGLLAVAAGAQAETRDHRGQPKLVAAPKVCGYGSYTPGCIPRYRDAYCKHNAKCTDHRNK